MDLPRPDGSHLRGEPQSAATTDVPALADPLTCVEMFLRLAATAAHIVPDPAWRRRAAFYRSLADSVAARIEAAA